MRKILFLLLVVSSKFCFSQQLTAIDTVAITLADAEEQFIKNNYTILAQKFNVDAQKALIRQAGLLNNPTVYYENGIYNQLSKKFFPTQEGKLGSPQTQGEILINAQWLISIAQKRIKTQQVAKAQADVVQYQFDDVIRSLLFALRGDFYELSYGLKSLRLFDDEIASVKDIVTGFELQYQKGNASLRDITRVRALLLSLQGDRFALYTSLQQSAKEFSVLLNNPKNSWYKPVFNEADAETKYAAISSIALSDLVSQAMTNRPDLKASAAQLAYNEAYVKLQKAIGVPDVQLQYTFDRNGSYIPNYSGAGLQIPIAIFNRNQGNIKSAKLQQEAADQLLKQKQVSVQNDVFTSYQKILELQNLNSSLSNNFSTDFTALLKGANENFSKKNLSLLEFVDMFESYKASMAQYNNIKMQRLSAFEELNFNVGKDVFKK